MITKEEWRGKAMGQYNSSGWREEFTELVCLYSELANIADRQMN